MKLSKAVRPVTFLKTHTAELIREVNETRDTIIITQNSVYCDNLVFRTRPF